MLTAKRLAAATPEHPARIGQFDVVGTIRAGGMGRVFDAVHIADGARVALKTLTHVDPERLSRFKNEFRSVADLSHPNVVQLYELNCHDGVWFFTMERIDGVHFLEPLRGASERATDGSTPERGLTPTVRAARVISAQRESVPDADRARPTPSPPVSIDRVRDAFEQLVRGVRFLHAHRLLHLDLKPSNVLIDGNGRVVVLDFGLVRTVGSAALAQSAADRGTVAGSPHWMAPEQFSGIDIGEATDWYAVGLMLYEALTGIAAFERASLVATWYARQHLAPNAPSRLIEGIPADLSALAVALLRAEPSMRPSGEAIANVLGGAKNDAASVLTQLSRSEFVGRESERAALHDAHRIALANGLVAVHVTGPSGVGKSALLHRFAEEASMEGETIVLRGRCYERETVPYKGFDGIVDELAAWLRARPQVSVMSDLPNRVTELVGVFPVLASVRAIAARLDVSEPAVGVSVIELRRRAVHAFRELMVKLLVKHPIVLQLDDLQWADGDCASLLARLLEAPTPRRLLLAMSFRPNEAASNPALQPYFEAAHSLDQRERARLVTIAIGALPTGDAETLAKATLRAHGIAMDGLAEAIASESGGIPFFVEEIAHHVAQRAGSDRARPASLEGVSLENVLAQRVQALPDVERALVETLSVAVSPIPLSVWFAVAGVDPSESRALWVLRGSRFVRSTGASADDRIELHHDRMREAVLGYMPSARIDHYHLRLGRALSERRDDDAGPWLFDAIRHLRAVAAQLEPAERLETARLHRLAGTRARRASAFALAFDCFRAGVALLDESAWNTEYDLALALHSGAAESAYLSAEWGSVAAYVDSVKSRARSILDQFVAWEVQIDASIARKDYAAALDAASTALQLLDVHLPADPTEAEVTDAVKAAWSSVTRIGPEGFAALAQATDPNVRAAMRLQARISSAAYFARPRLFPLIACRLVTSSVDCGLSPASPFALAVFGIVLNSMGLHRDAHAWGDVALSLIARFDDRSLEARTRHVVHDLVCVFTVPLESTLEDLRSVVEIGKETGDLEYGAYAAHAYVHNAFYASRELSTLYAQAVAYGEFMRGYEQVNALHVHAPFEQALRCFLGLSRDPASLDDEHFNEREALETARQTGSRSAQCIVRLMMGVVRYHFGSIEEASAHFEDARAFLDGVVSTWHVPMFHQYAALAIWGLPAAKREALRARAEESAAALRAFAVQGAGNFAHRVDLVRAEQSRAEGDIAGALAAFDRAIAGARAHAFLNAAALAAELAARAARTSGDLLRAERYRTVAIETYAQWGAVAHVRALAPTP